MKRIGPQIFNSKFNSFSPSSISGLLAWWKSDAGVLNPSDAGASHSDLVKTWEDQSGNGRSLQQGTGSNRPTLDAATFSKPVISFNEARPDFLITTTTQPADTPAFTIFLIWAPRTGINANAIVFNGSQSGLGPIFLDGTGTDTFYLNSGSSVLGSAYTLDTFSYSSLIFNGASSKHFKNGVQQGTTANPGARNLAGFCLGSYITGSDPSHMYVSECIIFNSELAGADLTNMHTYLAGRVPV